MNKLIETPINPEIDKSSIVNNTSSVTKDVARNTITIDEETLDCTKFSNIKKELPKEVRLKNEFAFALMSFSKQEQNCLFTAMSLFDSNEFLYNEEVHPQISINGEFDFSKITDEMIYKYYWSPSHRSVCIPIKNLLSLSNTRNYKAIDGPLLSLHSSASGRGQNGIILRRRSARGRLEHQEAILYPFERIVKIDNKTVLATFTQTFMPYIIAYSSFKKLSLDTLGRMKYKFSPQMYIWFKYYFELGSDAFNRPVPVEAFKEMFPEAAAGKNFNKRVVMQSIDEINKTSDLFIDAKGVYDETKHGKPITGYIFHVSKQKVPDLKSKRQPKEKIEKLKDSPFSGQTLYDNPNYVAENF